MAMPAANGLFHRAIAESPLPLHFQALPRIPAARTAQIVLSGLDIGDRPDDIQQAPWERVLAVTGKRLPLAPVIDGDTLPVDPFVSGAPDISADVRLLIGSNATETKSLLQMGNPGAAKLFDLGEADLPAVVAETVQIKPEDATKLIATYRKSHPAVSPARLFFLITTDRSWRTTAITIAERKAAQGKAPAFMYLWRRETPVLDGKFGAPQSVEPPFVFHEVDNKANCDTGSAPERYKLQDQAAGAWVAFARSGNPSHSGLPDRPARDANRRATMIFDTTSKVEDDPGGEERQALKELTARG